jgi:hypothetical protein
MVGLPGGHAEKKGHPMEELCRLVEAGESWEWDDGLRIVRHCLEVCAVMDREDFMVAIQFESQEKMPVPCYASVSALPSLAAVFNPDKKGGNSGKHKHDDWPRRSFLFLGGRNGGRWCGCKSRGRRRWGCLICLSSEPCLDLGTDFLKGRAWNSASTRLDRWWVHGNIFVTRRWLDRGCQEFHAVVTIPALNKKADVSAHMIKIKQGFESDLQIDF